MTLWQSTGRPIDHKVAQLAQQLLECGLSDQPAQSALIIQRLAAALRPKNVVSVEYEVGNMAIEHARAHTLPKPWGVVDTRLFSNARHDGELEQKTWLLVVNGSARAGSIGVAKGDAVFVQSDRVNMHAGTVGLVGLVAYTGVDGVASDLLRRLGQPDAGGARQPQEVQLPTSLAGANAGPTDGCMEATQ